MIGRQGRNGQLVERWGQVEANIRTLETARSSQNAQLRRHYEKLVKNGTCFVTYLSSSGVAFAPSKFIGYVDNDIVFHCEVRRDRQGGDTNRAMEERVLGRGPELDLSTEVLYRQFCRELGFEPRENGTGGHPRKFWLTDKVVGSDEEAAVAAIQGDPKLTQTEKVQLVKARYGQGQFRDDLISLWGECCLTGCAKIKLLRASHIKPWSKSDNHERLDKFNGFLLTPNTDALFDQGYITFSDNGEMLISARLCEEAASVLLAECRKKVEIYDENKPYLEYHRSRRFQGEAAQRKVSSEVPTGSAKLRRQGRR